MFSHSWSPLISAGAPAARTPSIGWGQWFLSGNIVLFLFKSNSKIAFANLIALAIEKFRPAEKLQHIQITGFL